MEGRPPILSLQKPTVYLPNWAMAGLLLTFVGGTYWYTLHAVGKEDLSEELRKEYERQKQAKT